MKKWYLPRSHELPPEQHRVMQKAVRLEWISLVYFTTAIAFTAVVMGGSQAMRTAFFQASATLRSAASS